MSATPDDHAGTDEILDPDSPGARATQPLDAPAAGDAPEPNEPS